MIKSREQLRESLEHNLKRYWGYDSFRPHQLEAMERVCGGGDALVLMPTGGGKSLLYQLPALELSGVCIVITPLVALMKDQVDRLRKMGVSAAAIHSGMTIRQIDITLDNANWGDLKLLYIAPERIANPTFRDRLRSMEVSLLAVDEAHCISQWGHDFRPSYLRISELRELLPGVAILALTASATPRVVVDIIESLKIGDGCTIRSSFARNNLSFSVRRVDDKRGQLLRIINGVAGSGIVYVRRREECEKLAQWLAEQGVGAVAYHAGMSHSQRGERQDGWSRGEHRVMVSTNAFGMGIDKSDVRFVVHYDICDSLEEYYQEAGRAGRDGVISYCVLLLGSDDMGRARKRFQMEYPSLEAIKSCYEALFNYLQVGIGDGKYAVFNFNIHEFAARSRIYIGTVRNSIKILQQNGYMTLTEESENPPRILFSIDRDDLYRVRIEREELDRVIRTILRLYSGLFSGRFVLIDQQEIAQRADVSEGRLEELLKELWQMHVIRYIPKNHSPILMLNEERLPQSDLYISPESYHLRKERELERIEAMYRYAQSEGVCRGVALQSYFGESDAEPCGVCDWCLERKAELRNKGAQERVDVGGVGGVGLSERIMAALAVEGLSVKQIAQLKGVNSEQVVATIDALLDSGRIFMTNGGKIEIKR